MAATAGLGVRAAVPVLRGGRGRRGQRRSGPAEKEAEGSAEEGEPTQPPTERDFVFRAPIVLSKPGELQDEYRSRLRKLRDEKLQEERTSEDFIHKLILEDPDAGRRKTEDLKKEDSLVVRMTQEQFPERLSDSENEEPSQGKSAHRSAFVSKGSTYSLALLTGNLTSKLERSQSCNDTLRDRSKSRQRSAPTRAKGNPLTGASASLVGVLSPTQNNRCLSAPDLTAEKRLIFSAATLLSTLQKPERSISPESNDSISEELNHFKPIVCSPCTPPKRLPDGKVLSPLIIKSTPRNLTRSLQKPTTYEASPRILKKWEQIFQERQMKKTLSKATLTSLAPETGEDLLSPHVNLLNVVKKSNDTLPADAVMRTQADLDCMPPMGAAKLEGADGVRREADDGPTAPTVRSSKTILRHRASEVSDRKPALHLAGSCLSIDAKMVTRKVMRLNSMFPENGTLGSPAKVTGKKPRKYLNESELSSFQNGICIERVLGEDPPPLRWGRKRKCKMKHLEQHSSAKRLRQGAFAATDPLQSGEAEQRLRQEEADRRLALQLQRKFDSENRIVSRRKGRVDQYFLRSKSTLGAK